jgi:ABC-type lipoprotein release transport system permease subunit
VQALLALEGRIHEVALRATRREAIDTLARTLRAALPEDEALVRTWREVNPMAAQMLATQDAGVWLLLILVFAVAGLGILNTMLMAVFERTRELGVMRALGMSPGKVVWLVLLETTLMGVLSAAIGGAGGLVLAWLLQTRGLDLSSFTQGVSAMGMTFDPVLHGQLRLDRVGLVAGFVVGVSLVSSLWPALRAARLDPVVAMREDA